MQTAKPAVTVRNIWPKEAYRLVAKPGAKYQARLLHNKLQEMTGFSSQSCWRFLEKHEIKRPGARKSIRFDSQTLDYVMDHGYAKAAEYYHCSKKKLYDFVHRQDRSVGHSASYSMRRLSKHLSIRPEIIKQRIDSHMLEATPITRGSGSSFIVSDDQLRRFLTKHASGLTSSKWFSARRAKFILDYLYEEKHMDLGLLRTRESKKEGDAFRNGEYRSTGKNQAADDIVGDNKA